MKLVLNKCYGCFSIPKFALNILGLKSEYDYIERDNSMLIKLVESNPQEFSNGVAKLKVVEIPDDITDYKIIEYDGLERVIYVRNGKIFFT